MYAIITTVRYFT